MNNFSYITIFDSYHQIHFHISFIKFKFLSVFIRGGSLLKQMLTGLINKYTKKFILFCLFFENLLAFNSLNL